MWKAINAAAGNNGTWKNKIHPINGLRVIRDFERINNVSFDPLNTHHVVAVATYGRSLIALKALTMGLEEFKNAIDNFGREPNAKQASDGKASEALPERADD